MTKTQILKKVLKRQRTHPCKSMMEFVFEKIGIKRHLLETENEYTYFIRVLSLLLKNHIDYIEKDEFGFFYKSDIKNELDFYKTKCFRLNPIKKDFLINFLKACLEKRGEEKKTEEDTKKKKLEEDKKEEEKMELIGVFLLGKGISQNKIDNFLSLREKMKKISGFSGFKNYFPEYHRGQLPQSHTEDTLIDLDLSKILTFLTEQTDKEKKEITTEMTEILKLLEIQDKMLSGTKDKTTTDYSVLSYIILSNIKHLLETKQDSNKQKILKELEATLKSITQGGGSKKKYKGFNVYNEVNSHEEKRDEPNFLVNMFKDDKFLELFPKIIKDLKYKLDPNLTTENYFEAKEEYMELMKKEERFKMLTDSGVIATIDFDRGRSTVILEAIKSKLKKKGLDFVFFNLELYYVFYLAFINHTNEKSGDILSKWVNELLNLLYREFEEYEEPKKLDDFDENSRPSICQVLNTRKSEEKFFSKKNDSCKMTGIKGDSFALRQVSGYKEKSGGSKRKSNRRKTYKRKSNRKKTYKKKSNPRKTNKKTRRRKR